MFDPGPRRENRPIETLGVVGDTPFVVEGYAGGVTSDERYVGSRSRAQLVRDYLQGRYGLDPAYVGVMPLGVEAPESPAGGTWDGVALAAFVQRSGRR